MYTFSQALEYLKQGQSVTRHGWNGKGQWIQLQRPTELSKMTLPYIFIRTVKGDLVPWLASQTDILAEDWIVIDPTLSAPSSQGGNEKKV